MQEQIFRIKFVLNELDVLWFNHISAWRVVSIVRYRKGSQIKATLGQAKGESRNQSSTIYFLSLVNSDPIFIPQFFRL